MKKKASKIVDEFNSEFDRGDSSFLVHLLAGSCAGISEHMIMFPVDVIKTRLMAGRAKRGFFHTFVTTGSRSPRCLFRGMPVAILGAIPSHAALFATYEFLKRLSPRQNLFFYGLSGVGATMIHDLFANSFGVIKTRIMLGRGRAGRKKGYHLFRQVLKREGTRAFFVSYPVSLLMNIPFVIGYFATYEILKRRLTNYVSPTFKPLVCGGIGGMVGALISNPFDVIRIRQQNESRLTMSQHAVGVYRKFGLRGFFKGSSARMFYYLPSGAITWFTYETVKNFLS